MEWDVFLTKAGMTQEHGLPSTAVPNAAGQNMYNGHKHLHAEGGICPAQAVGDVRHDLLPGRAQWAAATVRHDCQNPDLGACRHMGAPCCVMVFETQPTLF